MKGDVKFSIVGCGRIGFRHAEHINNQAELSAVCDIDKNALKKMKDKYPDVKVYDNIDSMLDDDKDSQVVNICTPNGLHAEHTINASTFSVLVNSSTLSAPYSVISSAIGCLSGPLHGGANAKVLHMLEQVGKPENAAQFVDDQLQRKGKIWGMGHREYKVKDPRATILQGLIKELLEARGGDVNPLFEVAEALEKACEDRLAEKGVYANVDYYSGLLYREMGIPDNQFTTIFAIARSAGWLAHWREQLKNNRIFRPTQIYIGKQQRSYVAMDMR